MRELYRVNAPTARALNPIATMGGVGPVIFYLHWPYPGTTRLEEWPGPEIPRHARALRVVLLGNLMRAPPFPALVRVVEDGITRCPEPLAHVLGWLTVVGRGLLSCSAHPGVGARPP